MTEQDKQIADLTWDELQDRRDRLVAETLADVAELERPAAGSEPTITVRLTLKALVVGPEGLGMPDPETVTLNVNVRDGLDTYLANRFDPEEIETDLGQALDEYAWLLVRKYRESLAARMRAAS